MHVENKDIIITDPCYIIKEYTNPYPYPDTLEDYVESDYYKYEQEHDDWERCSYGEEMEELGFTNYICRDTICGDWSCTTFDEDTNTSIGGFCADAGMVAVLELDEVLKYNPDFDYHINRPWTTTLIKNFTGDIDFEVNGDMVSVVGKGNINFYTEQSDF